MNTPRRMQLVVWLMLLCRACCALTESDLRALVPVDPVELPRMLVEQLRWLPDSRHVVVGGYLEWPASPLVTVLPSDIPAVQTLGQAASSHLVVSPEGNTVAFWRRTQTAGQDRAELTLLNLMTGVVSTLGQPLESTAALHLAWSQAGGPVLYTTEDAQKRRGYLFAADLGGGRPYKVLEMQDGSWTGLANGPVPGQVIIGWNGTQGGRYNVDYRTGKVLPLPGGPVSMPTPGGSRPSLELDESGALQLTLSANEAVVLDRGVRGASWRPDGQALAFVKDSEVYLALPNGTRPHLLYRTNPADAVFLRGCAWSPDGVRLAYWGVSGNSGRAWQTALGQERVSAKFFFPQSAPVKVGSRLWIASKFYYDESGTLIKPVWETLKAQFTVTRLVRSPEGTVAEALSAGDQAGVAERIATSVRVPASQAGHITINVGGEVAAAWTQAATLQFKPGLRAWLEKTRFAGRPQSLSLERQTLPPIRSAAN